MDLESSNLEISSERLDLAEKDLRTVGFHIVENVITAEDADKARQATLALAETEAQNGKGSIYGEDKIRRVWALVSKGTIFCQLIQHPTVIAIWKRFLGEDVIASTFTANIVGPGAPAGGLHIDYPYLHKIAVLYINSCDGYTKFEDGTKIDSIANRMLIFDGDTMHTSSTTTNEIARCNINFNYF